MPTNNNPKISIICIIPKNTIPELFCLSHNDNLTRHLHEAKFSITSLAWLIVFESSFSYSKKKDIKQSNIS